MRHAIAPAVLLVLAASTTAFGQAANKAATEKTLIANEQKVADAIAKHDLKTFNELVVPDGIAADDTGFMKPADIGKTIDQLKIGSFHIMDSKVMWIDDKSAVVTYTWMGQGTYMNKPIPPVVYSSTLWTNRSGKWVAVFHQETPAAMPAKK